VSFWTILPGSRAWNPRAQAATVIYLIEVGADPNAIDQSGVTPLHRRCALVAPLPCAHFSKGAPMRDARIRAARRQCSSRPRTPAAVAPARESRKRAASGMNHEIGINRDLSGVPAQAGFRPF
jgi:hypothetical protein